MGLFYNDSLISPDNLDITQLKRVIQKHLNTSNKYAYVVKTIKDEEDGSLNIKALIRGDNHKVNELMIRNYKIKKC